MGVFHFFKLYKWYQIMQSTTCIDNTTATVSASSTSGVLFISLKHLVNGAQFLHATCLFLSSALCCVIVFYFNNSYSSLSNYVNITQVTNTWPQNLGLKYDFISIINPLNLVFCPELWWLITSIVLQISKCLYSILSLYL